MRKLFSVLAIIVLAKFKVYAQQEEPKNQLAFSIGPELVIPGRSVYSIGYGASAKIEIPVADKIIATATGAYQNLKYKSGLVASGLSQPDANFVPLKVGARYAAGQGVYLEAEVGDVMELTTNVFGTKRNLFAFSLGPGFLIKLSEKQKIDLGFRYEQWSQGVVQQTTIRVGYRVEL